jgi:hypothetical protein
MPAQEKGWTLLKKLCGRNEGSDPKTILKMVTGLLAQAELCEEGRLPKQDDHRLENKLSHKTHYRPMLSLNSE